jgi:DNA-binding MarR family transcriptional regulator
LSTIQRLVWQQDVRNPDTMPSTDLLAAFSVVDHRSVSAAARELGIGKSIVSKRLAQLEARVGATLLARSTRQVSLTPAGVIYVELSAVRWTWQPVPRRNCGRSAPS